jgi:hypothetical protein
MDKCFFDASKTKEVIDYAGFDNSATQSGYSVNTNEDGVLCRSAEFWGDKINIDDLNISTAATTKVSVSLWIKFDGQKDDVIPFGFEKHSLIFKDGRFGFTTGNGDVYGINLSDNNISDNSWHHIMAIFCNKALFGDSLYIDGVKQSLTLTNLPCHDNSCLSSFAAIGGNRSDDTHNFIGYIDEVKIFNGELDKSKVLQIYNNEKNHLNFDGSSRSCNNCGFVVLIGEYRFDECKYIGKGKEVINSVYEKANGTIDNLSVSISKNNSILGNSVYLQGSGINIDNLKVSSNENETYTVMFWMYWDGTDKVIPFGWRYYHLIINNNVFGFSTNSNDIYGLNISNFANRWHQITAIFVNKNIENCKIYIDGVKQTLKYFNTKPISSLAYATKDAKIGGTTSDNTNKFYGYLDELKIYFGEVNQNDIQTIYNYEKSGLTYKGLIRDPIICALPIFNAVDFDGGCFNWDNNITTKVAGKEIELSILAGDKSDNNNSISDVNITKVKLLGFDDINCKNKFLTQTVWSGNAQPQNGCYRIKFKYPNAIRCAKISIEGSNGDGVIESNSTDTFSIKPDKFVLKGIKEVDYHTLIAQKDYNVTIQAVNKNENITKYYDLSIPINYKKYLKDGSDGTTLMDGEFKPDGNISFKNGQTNEFNISFSNVGNVYFDINDTNWTIVDSDDTPLEKRITYFRKDLTFILDHYKVEFIKKPKIENFKNGNFTYYSNDLNMSAWLRNLSIKITAQGEKNATMTNYQNPQNKYFAKNIDINQYISLTPSKVYPSLKNKVNFDANFSKGEANISYEDIRFNYDRNCSMPKNPKNLIGSNYHITTEAIEHSLDNITGMKTSDFNGDAYFLYGKIETKDIYTKKILTKSFVKIDVYSSSNLNSFLQVSKNWYENLYDSNITSISSIEFYPKESLSFSSNDETKTNIKNQENFDKGTSNIYIKSISSTPFKAYYHLKIPSWLWYGKYSSYSIDTNSSCISHPCFEYIFSMDSNDTKVNSGEFEGTKMDSTPLINQNKGIKILR